jgi:serine kinase of HPr protein (carbohydrate metabolism regulator)
MKPVFFNHSSMNKKLSLEEIFQERFTKLGMQEIFPADGLQKKINTIQIRNINRIPFVPFNKDTPVIAILTPRSWSQICSMEKKLRKNVLVGILEKPVIFLILSSSSSIPLFLKTYNQKNNVPVAVSTFDEHYLVNLLQALLREKLQDIICVHGNVLEVKGMGVLIRGASGIGKTTAALKTVTKDNYWVADDVAVIKRNRKGELIACGHKKINNYVHIKTKGVIPIHNLLDSDRIKKTTKIAAVVEIEKSGIRDSQIIKGEKEILGTKLICFHINVPSTGYLDENLLKKALRQLAKDI